MTVRPIHALATALLAAFLLVAAACGADSPPHSEDRTERLERIAEDIAAAVLRRDAAFFRLHGAPAFNFADDGGFAPDVAGLLYGEDWPGRGALARLRTVEDILSAPPVSLDFGDDGRRVTILYRLSGGPIDTDYLHDEFMTDYAATSIEMDANGGWVFIEGIFFAASSGPYPRSYG